MGETHDSSESRPSSTPSTSIPAVLTFDDGPVAVHAGGRTRTVLAQLAAHKIVGAFFVQTGFDSRMGSAAGRAVVLEELGAGHVVGIHTGTRPTAPGLPRKAKKAQFDHRPYPERFRAPPYDVTGDNVADGASGLESDLIDAKGRISELAGAPPKYARATGGELGGGAVRAGILGVLAKLKLVHVPWNLDSGDSWKHSTASLVEGQLAKQAQRLASEGAAAMVVLFHDINATTAANLDAYIDALGAGAKKGGAVLRFTSSKNEANDVLQLMYGAHP